MIDTWNEIAPRYHKRWADKSIGPFQSSKKLVSMAKIRSGDTVLDLACGTGAVTREIATKIGRTGYLIGVDSSMTALSIAKKTLVKTNVDFINFDAENFGFNRKFDVITCQFALFFFPDSNRALDNIRKTLKKKGKLVLAVHGAGKTVPYFSSIMDSVQKFIPQYLPVGTPNFDRFGTTTNLKNTIIKAGFVNIVINEHNFWYSPGTFSKYWSDYYKYLAKPLRKKINELTPTQIAQLKKLIQEKTKPFTKNGIINFPWKILILCAKKP